MKKTFKGALLLILAGSLHTQAATPPPEYVGPPLPCQSVTNRGFTGISSMAVAPNGRLWVTWYAGPTPSEDENNYVVLSTSGDGGKTWKELLVVDPDGDGLRRTFDPELWISPDGKLRWFWSDREMPYNNVETDALWMMVFDDPASGTPKRHPPVYVAKGVMICKPIVLSTGEWALPVCTWYSDNSSKMVVSTDNGKTWSIRGGATIPKKERTFDEHTFVERKDGSIWVLSRTKSGIYESVSTDRGKTWPDMTPSAIAHPSARFFVTRLASGNLLLVKHGPIHKKTGRSQLTAFLSKDDGRTWEGGLMIDERSGVSYPDGQQVADGTICITYDFSRTGKRHILFATFREQDVLAGKPVSDAVRLRQIVTEGSGGHPRRFPKVNANADGAALLKKPAGALISDEGVQAQELKVGAKLFSDRKYICAEVPDALKGAQFLPVKIEGRNRKENIRCSRAGMVYFLTPVPKRNSDSVSASLIEQGFTKVALPEVHLFDPFNFYNFSTLYQKNCKEGETLTVKKWAVPLFFNP